MIDTDKYEGHTKGDDEVGWRMNNNFVLNGKRPTDKYIAYIKLNGEELEIVEFSDADANLIADAPLLLQEVKRLHLVEMSIQDFLDGKIDSLELCRNMRDMGVIE